jgi:hypothetical protein
VNNLIDFNLIEPLLNLLNNIKSDNNEDIYYYGISLLIRIFKYTETNRISELKIYIKEIIEGKSRNPNFSRSLFMEQLRNGTPYGGREREGGIRFLYDLIGGIS